MLFRSVFDLVHGCLSVCSVLFSVLEFGPVPTSPTPLLQGAPVRLLHCLSVRVQYKDDKVVSNPKNNFDDHQSTTRVSRQSTRSEAKTEDTLESRRSRKVSCHKRARKGSLDGRPAHATGAASCHSDASR